MAEGAYPKLKKPAVAIDELLELVSAGGLEGRKSVKVEGDGWLLTAYRGDGQPGTEMLRLELYVGPRHRRQWAQLNVSTKPKAKTPKKASEPTT